MEQNREKCNKNSLDSYHRHKNRRRSELKKRYKIDKDFRLMHIRATRNWEKDNPEKVKLQKKRYYEKYKLNPINQLNMNVKKSIYKSLKRNKNGCHWEDLVGYTLQDLKKHLQKQFTNGISWENYGQWHIDHIIPISAFNFQKSDNIDFRRCWNLKNLRPIWKNENLKKGCFLKIPFQPSLSI